MSCIARKSRGGYLIEEPYCTEKKMPVDLDAFLGVKLALSERLSDNVRTC